MRLCHYYSGQEVSNEDSADVNQLKKDNLTIEHVNAQLLQSSCEEIKMCVYDRDIDVLCVCVCVCVCETWLHTDTPNELVCTPDYVIYRCDNGRAGGVCIYVKKELKSNLISFPFTRQAGVEDLYVTVQSNKYPALVIGCVY